MIKKMVIILAVVFIISALVCYSIFAFGGGQGWWDRIVNGDGGFSFNPFRSNRGIMTGYDIDDQQSEKVTGIDNIEISSVSSDISVYVEDRDTASARLYGTFRSSSNQPVKLTCIKRGSTLIFKVEYPKGLNVNTSSNMKLDVWIPESYGAGLDLETVSGKIESDFILAETLQMDTVSGSIRVEEVQSENIRAHTVSGKITLTEISGQPKMDLKSVSGDVIADFTDALNDGKGTDEMKFKTTSGDVTITLDRNSEFKYDAKSVSGNFKCDLPIVIDSSGRNYSRGTVNGGTLPLNMETVSGDIEIKAR
jgi:DUF4097 and DUF4098 domain-containing protein YvlB